MYLVGWEVAMAPMGADGMGVKNECGVPSLFGTSVGTSSALTPLPP